MIHEPKKWLPKIGFKFPKKGLQMRILAFWTSNIFLLKTHETRIMSVSLITEHEKSGTKSLNNELMRDRESANDETIQNNWLAH